MDAFSVVEEGTGKAVVAGGSVGSVDELLIVRDGALDERVSLGGLVAYDGLVIVLARRVSGFGYVELLIRLLREVYRMGSRGLPRPLVVSSPASLEERLGELYASDGVSLVAVDGVKEWAVRRVREKLAELFSQGYGFLVVYSDDPLAVLGRALGVAVRNGRVVSPPAPIVYVESVIGSPDEVLARVNRVWGRFRGAERPWPPYRSFDEVSSISEYARHVDTRYYTGLARIAGSSVGQLEVPANRDGESLVHYALRVAVYMYMKYVEEMSDVVAEHKVGEGIVADVHGGGVIVEVETFYGRGMPLLRLRGLVVDRAEFIKEGGEMWIVAPPLQAALLPRQWIRSFMRWVRERHGGSVKLFTIDVDEAVRLVKSVERGKVDTNMRLLVRLI